MRCRFAGLSPHILPCISGRLRLVLLLALLQQVRVHGGLDGSQSPPKKQKKSKEDTKEVTGPATTTKEFLTSTDASSTIKATQRVQVETDGGSSDIPQLGDKEKEVPLHVEVLGTPGEHQSRTRPVDMKDRTRWTNATEHRLDHGNDTNTSKAKNGSSANSTRQHPGSDGHPLHSAPEGHASTTSSATEASGGQGARHSAIPTPRGGSSTTSSPKDTKNHSILPLDFGRLERYGSPNTSPYVSQQRLDNLWQYLFKSYHKEAPPVPEDGGPLLVGVGINFVKFRDFDEASGTMNIALTLRLCWADPRLSFDAQDFFNKSWTHEGDKIPIKSRLVWTPDITVMNEVGGHNFLRKETSPLVLSDNAFRNQTGVNVLWSRPLDVKSNCEVDMSLYPFDVQKCYIVIGSWASSQRQMLLVPQPFFEEYTVHTSEFRVSSITAAEHSAYTKTTADFFDEVKYSLVLHRYPHYYVVNFIMPMIAITLLTVATMWMSPGNVGPRVNSGTKLLLCVVSIIFITARQRPKIHGDIWMDCFQSHCLALSMTAVLESMFIDYYSKTTVHLPWTPRPEVVDAVLRALISGLTTYVIFHDASAVTHHHAFDLYTSFQAASTKLLVAFVFLTFTLLISSSIFNLVCALTPRSWRKRCIRRDEEDPIEASVEDGSATGSPDRGKQSFVEIEIAGSTPPRRTSTQRYTLCPTEAA